MRACACACSILALLAVLLACVCLQLLCDMLDHSMDPQSALDTPRFCVDKLDSSVGPASVEDSYVLLVRLTTKHLLHVTTRGFALCVSCMISTRV